MTRAQKKRALLRDCLLLLLVLLIGIGGSILAEIIMPSVM